MKLKAPFVYIILILVILKATNVVLSVAIDNGVVGAPLIECTTNSINIKVNTQKPFFGRLFVKGMSRSSQCTQDYSRSNGAVTNVQLTIPMGNCDMQRERQLNPSGLQQITTVIVSFHALFITKVDRAYSVRCFYMATGEKVITQEYQVRLLRTNCICGRIVPGGELPGRITGDELSISQHNGTALHVKITTQDFQQASPMMPSCEYTVRRGSLTGSLVQYAIVGEKLYHVWKCLAAGAFGILIRNCVVQDSARTQFVAIDTQGCTTDKTVVNDLTYGVNLDEAYVEVHAFKFADDVNVFFKCEITFCQKNPPPGQAGETSCRGVTPPACNSRAVAISQAPVVELTASSSSSTVSSFPPVSTSIFSTTAKQPYKHQRSLDGEPESEYSYNQAMPLKASVNSNNMRVIDVVPKNNFVVLDPMENGTSNRWDDRFLTPDFGRFDVDDDGHRSKNKGKQNGGIKSKESTDQNQQQSITVGERWTFISLGFGIMSSLLVVSFLMIFVLIYMLCKRPLFDHSVYDHYSMSPVSTLRRILPRY